ITHRLPQLYRSLKAQKADIYYCRIRDFRHILAFWAARKVKGKFVLGLASDLDAMNFAMRFKYQHLVSSGSVWSFSSGLLIEIVYPFLLRKADLVLVQHDGQKKILAKKNIKSIVFPNLIDLNGKAPVPTNRSDNFIYVGSLDKRKGFAEFYELVKKASGYSYKIVGQPRDKTAHLYYEKLKTFHNVILLGRLSHAETMCQIANSKAVISTSPMEGFPNIFIEAWACGLPVLSLYCDPGGIIEKEKLGEIGHGNLDKIIQSMSVLKNSAQFAQKAKAYVEKNHIINAEKIKQINQVTNELYKTEKIK
ncbi:MAG: glycosyltransferase family 4 protein, partial [Ginsengibacter sp.]